MRSLEGGGWKSTSNGNSLATYPTARPDLNGRGWTLIVPLDPTQIGYVSPVNFEENYLANQPSVT
jgi:hypothetical protein